MSEDFYDDDDISSVLDDGDSATYIELPSPVVPYNGEDMVGDDGFGTTEHALKECQSDNARLKAELKACRNTFPAEVDRKYSNMWKAKFFEMLYQVQKANKGLLRLHRRVARLKLIAADAEDGAKALSEALGEVDALKAEIDSNWSHLVKEYDELIGSTYSNEKGEHYQFIGLLRGDDDYYFVMWRKNDLQLLTCVGTPEQQGFRQEGGRDE